MASSSILAVLYLLDSTHCGEVDVEGSVASCLPPCCRMRSVRRATSCCCWREDQASERAFADWSCNRIGHWACERAAPADGGPPQREPMGSALNWLIFKILKTKSRGNGACLTCQEIFTILCYGLGMGWALKALVQPSDVGMSQSPPPRTLPSSQSYLAPCGVGISTTLLFAPNTSDAQAVVSAAASLISLPDPSGLACHTEGFATTADLLAAYATSPARQQAATAAILFNGNAGTLSANYTLALSRNLVSIGEIDRRNFEWPRMDAYRAVHEGVNDGDSIWLSSGFVTVQWAVDRALVGFLGGPSNGTAHSTDETRFPLQPYKTSYGHGASILHFLLPLFGFIPSITICFLLGQFMIIEKAYQLVEGLQMMGMQYRNYYGSWLVVYGVLMLAWAVVQLMGFLAMGYFPESDLGLMFIHFLLSGLSFLPAQFCERRLCMHVHACVLLTWLGVPPSSSGSATCTCCHATFTPPAATPPAATTRNHLLPHQTWSLFTRAGPTTPRRPSKTSRALPSSPCFSTLASLPYATSSTYPYGPSAYSPSFRRCRALTSPLSQPPSSPHTRAHLPTDQPAHPLTDQPGPPQVAALNGLALFVQAEQVGMGLGWSDLLWTKDGTMAPLLALDGLILVSFFWNFFWAVQAGKAVPGFDRTHQPWAPCRPRAHQPWAPCGPRAHQPWGRCDHRLAGPQEGLDAQPVQGGSGRRAWRSWHR